MASTMRSRVIRCDISSIYAIVRSRAQEQFVLISAWDRG
jgi:hypothetical protein